MYYILTYIFMTLLTNTLQLAFTNEDLDMKVPQEFYLQTYLNRDRLLGSRRNVSLALPTVPTPPSRTLLKGVTMNYDLHPTFVHRFPGFLAAIIVSVFCKVPVAIRIHMTALHLLSRLAFTAFYILNWDYPRTFAWQVGFWCCMILFGWAIVPGFETWFLQVGKILAAKSITKL